MIQDIKKNDL